jgi:predicted nucleic acid-binding protein
VVLTYELDRIIAACNTGPLLSAFQCDGVDWLKRYLIRVYVAPVQQAEFVKHGAKDEFQTLLDERFVWTASDLSEAEKNRAMSLAEQIADQPMSNDPDLASHLPEAEMLVIAARPELECKIVLLDEKAARTVASELGFRVTGFPGILARAGLDDLLAKGEIRRMLRQCQQQGTHYSNALIEHVAETYGRR